MQAVSTYSFIYVQPYMNFPSYCAAVFYDYQDLDITTSHPLCIAGPHRWDRRLFKKRDLGCPQDLLHCQAESHQNRRLLQQHQMAQALFYFFFRRYTPVIIVFQEIFENLKQILFQV